MTPEIPAAAVNLARQLGLLDDENAMTTLDLSSLRQAAVMLEALSAKDALAVAKSLGVSTAKTKKDAIVRMTQKLTDLNTTLNKTRMYG